MSRMRLGHHPPELHQFHQIDMRDWLFWLDAARTLAIAAGREHRRLHTITTEALRWHALHDRMLAAGLHELRDEPLFRVAKTLYLQVESETARGVATHAR
jgi:hypothetical protein